MARLYEFVSFDCQILTGRSVDILCKHGCCKFTMVKLPFYDVLACENFSVMHDIIILKDFRHAFTYITPYYAPISFIYTFKYLLKIY